MQDIQVVQTTGAATSPAAVVSTFKHEVPKATRATLKRAKKIASEGKAELALSLMREASKVFPHYFKAHLELGNMLLQTGQLKEPIAELDRV